MKPIIPDAALQQHIAVLGKTRSGKSSVMRGLVEGLLDREQPVCIVDPKGDWWGIKLGRDGKRAGYPVVIFGGEHADVPINEHAGAHVAELFATGNRPCLIDLGGWMVGARTRFWIDFASTLFKLTKGMRWLAVDEIHNFAPKGKVMDPDAGKALHWTNRLASEGLGKGLPMLFASQRPQKVHNDTLTSAETLIAMRVLHPADRGAVSDWIKGCGDLELGAQVLNSLAQMARGEGWVWSPEIGFGPERVKFPLFKTYDSFRPQSAEDAAALKGWATVDLDEVKAKLAKVVQEAEANDPAKLKAEVRRLTAELAKKPAGAPAKGKPAGPRAEDLATIKALRKALENAMKFIIEISAKGFDGKVDAEAMQKALASAAQTAASIVERHVEQRNREFAKLRQQAERAVKGLEALLDRDVTVKLDVQHNEPFSVTQRRIPPPAIDHTNPELMALASAQRKILNALAFLEKVGISPADKTQASLFADMSPTAGHTQNMYGGLRTAALIEYQGNGMVTLTDAGRALADPGRVPQTAQEMQAILLAKVAAAQRKLLTVLIDVYPEAIDKRVCSEKAGLSPDAGHTQNMYGGLRSLGLIEYPQPGKVVALPVLFLEGGR